MHLSVSTFFDVTPIGRILARFSSDTNTVDVVLPHQVSMWLPTLLRVSNLVQFICVMIVKIAIMPRPPKLLWCIIGEWTLVAWKWMCQIFFFFLWMQGIPFSVSQRLFHTFMSHCSEVDSKQCDICTSTRTLPIYATASPPI